MSLDPIHVECDHCGTSFVATPKRTFLGFQRLTCKNCHAKIIHPLTPGFRITYWVIAVLLLIFIVNAFGSGGYAYPGGVGIAVLFAIYRDWTLRKRISTQAPPPAQKRAIRSPTTSPVATNTCASCGYLAPAHMKFCPECGVKLVAERHEPEAVVARSPTPSSIQQDQALATSGSTAQLTPSALPAAPALAKNHQSNENHDRLLLLCQRLRTGDLALDQYQALAKAVGASVRQEGFFGGKYIVSHGYTLVSFNNVPSMKPWFLQHVVPAIESKA